MWFRGVCLGLGEFDGTCVCAIRILFLLSELYANLPVGSCVLLRTHEAVPKRIRFPEPGRCSSIVEPGPAPEKSRKC